MAKENVGLKFDFTRFRLVKWDGDPPIPEDAETEPQKYPQVAEVLEGGEGIPTRVIYRRSA
jgi:hypothetical protein